MCRVFTLSMPHGRTQLSNRNAPRVPIHDRILNSARICRLSEMQAVRLWDEDADISHRTAHPLLLAPLLHAHALPVSLSPSGARTSHFPHANGSTALSANLTFSPFSTIASLQLLTPTIFGCRIPFLQLFRLETGHKIEVVSGSPPLCYGAEDTHRNEKTRKEKWRTVFRQARSTS